MSASRKQWLLKVISGPHQGAEIALVTGKTLVGSDDQCDVILHDVLVAPQHLELELHATEIIAAPLGGRVFLNGKRIRDARQKVAPFEFISIGSSHLVLGPADGVWPLLSAADAPELEKEKEAEPAAEAKAEERQPEQVPAAAGDASAQASALGRPAAAQTVSRLGPLVGIAAGILLLVGWAYVYWLYKQNDGKAEAAPLVQTPVERARAIIDDLELAGSVRVEEMGGRLTATGYVDTESRQRELQAVFRAEVPGIRTRIYSLEKIASSARSLIEAQRLPLQVSSLTEGKLKISGKLPAADPWLAMRQTLMNEVPGLSGIEDNVEIEAVRPVAPSSLAGSRPSLPPPLTSLPPLPVLPPIAPTPSSASSAAAPNKPVASTESLVTQDTIDTPESTIATMRVDAAGLSYVRLNTGGVYFVGARLPFGGTISRIENDTVTIIEQGVTRVLRQGDAVAKTKSSISSTP